MKESAKRDRQAHAEQEQLRLAYLDWRERAAKRRKYDLSLHARLAHGRTALLQRIDTEQLHVCRSCDEIAYPTKPVTASYGTWGSPREPVHCHFCGAHDLEAWDSRRTTELERGTGRLPDGQEADEANRRRPR